jgi:hypothetical protein
MPFINNIGVKRLYNDYNNKELLFKIHWSILKYI